MDNIDIEFMDDSDDELDDATIRAALQALDEAQAEDEERMFLEADKMPCPECSGGGATQGGSLGNMCPRCSGQRVVAIPGSQPQPLVNWKQLRAPWSDYAKAKDRLGLAPSIPCPFCAGLGTRPGKPPCEQCGGTGSKARPIAALPPASTLPTVDFIEKMRDQVRGRVAELGGGAAANLPELAPAPAEPDKTSLGGHTDEELDRIQDAVLEEDGNAGTSAAPQALSGQSQYVPSPQASAPRLAYLRGGSIANAEYEFQYEYPLSKKHPGWVRKSIDLSTLRTPEEVAPQKERVRAPRHSWWHRLCVFFGWRKPPIPVARLESKDGQ